MSEMHVVISLLNGVFMNVFYWSSGRDLAPEFTELAPPTDWLL